MAEIIGTSASVVALAGTAFTLVREVRRARDKVRGSSKTLDEASQQLAGLERSLDLVREEGSLQTAAVEQQLGAIASVTRELQSFFDRLTTEQQERRSVQFVHALKSGDKDDKELQGILDRLDRARNELVLRISVAQVGLVGDLRGRFRVAFSVLAETNEKVKQVLGVNLVLMDRLEARAMWQRDGMIPLSTSDVEGLGLSGTRAAARDVTTSKDETSIYDNITLGQARIMTGNVGVEDWQRVAGRTARISNNQFKGNVRIMTGDQGGEAAARFNESFWG